MESTTFRYDPATGWSVPSFPALDSERTLVLVFGARGFLEAPGALEELTRAYPRSVIAGCSSAGEIFGAAIGDGGLAVAVARFAKGRLRIASTFVDASTVSSAAGEAVARSLLAPDLRAVFVLSDGTTVNGTELLGGIHRAVAPDVVVTGGLAGDGTQFQKTWVLVDGKPTSGAVTAVGLYGSDVGISHGCRGGWDAFGPERVVTRSAGNVLSELDGEPALALYKSYLGDRAAGLPATALLFPLALRRSSGQERLIVRTILSVDEETQTMTFAGDIGQESVVQLMRANLDRLVEGAAEAGRLSAREHEGDSLTIAISCVGRRLVLGERAEEEVEAALEATPKSDLIGFYSYGEIAPFAPGERAILHNQTMTMTRIWEA